MKEKDTKENNFSTKTHTIKMRLRIVFAFPTFDRSFIAMRDEIE